MPLLWPPWPGGDVCRKQGFNLRRGGRVHTLLRRTVEGSSAIGDGRQVAREDGLADCGGSRMGALMLGVASRLRWPLAALVVRCLAWVCARTVYRVRGAGRENMPTSGPVLLVANHLGWVEGVLLAAVQRRPIRFVVDSRDVQSALLARLGRWLGVIPIPLAEGPRAIVEGLRVARQALAAGEAVCIFAEGQMGRAGGLLPFRRGLRRITGSRDVPVVPVYLDLAWGGNLSFRDGRLRWRIPSPIPYPAAVVFGRPLSAQSAPWQVRQAVQEAGVRCFRLRKPDQTPLPRRVGREGPRH